MLKARVKLKQTNILGLIYFRILIEQTSTNCFVTPTHMIFPESKKKNVLMKIVFFLFFIGDNVLK